MAVHEWIAFDLETTGLFSPGDRIVEIGAVRFDASGRELDQFTRLVNPERPVSPGAQAIHGLSDAVLASARPARDVLPEFLTFLGDPDTAYLLAHNAEFDCRFLGHELARAGLPRPGHAAIDTLALARRCRPDLPGHRLDTLARVLCLDSHEPHRALADCRRVKQLWLTLGGPLLPIESHVLYPILDVSQPAAVPLGWETLLSAIAGGYRIRMEYTGGTRGEAPREITPRGFVQRGGVSYLRALCHMDDLEKSFRLDRVRCYEIVREPV